jgi:hypothetical protein
MNYQYIHNAIISRAKTRTLDSSVYTERHHIQPIFSHPELRRYVNNIVTLTGREHFLIHNLLRRMYPNEPRYLYAFIRMSHVNQYTAEGRTEIIVKYARHFEAARKAKAEHFRQRKLAYWSDPANKATQSNKMLGNTFGRLRTEAGRKRAVMALQTEEYRQQVSERMQRMWANTEFRTIQSKRQSNQMMGNTYAKNINRDEAYRTKISEANRGQKRTADTKQKMAVAKAQAWIVTSPNGIEETIMNLRQFCREQDIDQGNMVKVSKGLLPATKGWTCRKAA